MSPWEAGAGMDEDWSRGSEKELWVWIFPPSCIDYCVKSKIQGLRSYLPISESCSRNVVLLQVCQSQGASAKPIIQSLAVLSQNDRRAQQSSAGKSQTAQTPSWERNLGVGVYVQECVCRCEQECL